MERVEFSPGRGARLALLRVRAAPGGRGDPVLLVPALGMSAWALNYGERSPARVFSRSGYEVFLLGLPGAGDPYASDCDRWLRGVLPRALDRVCSLTQRPQAAWWGLGAGGLLGLAASARREPLHAVMAVGAGAALTPVPRASWFSALSRLLPSGCRLPLTALGRWGALAVDQKLARRTQLPGPTARGLLRFGLEDAPVSLVRQSFAWRQSWSSADGAIDQEEALCGAKNAALFVEEAATSAKAERLAQRWGAPDAAVLPSSLGELGWLAADAEAWAPVLAWLKQHPSERVDSSRVRDSSAG